MTIDIRRLGPGDAAVLERVADDVFDASIDPERLAAYLAEPGHLMIVAIHDGEVVGQAMAMTRAERTARAMKPVRSLSRQKSCPAGVAWQRAPVRGMMAA